MPGYQVKFESHRLGSSQFEIRSLLNRQQYADPEGLALAAGISEASWPLFGMIWPSARMLANAMQTQEIEGKRILEVGCGLGLASLVLHRRLGNITASDCHPLAGGFLQENARLNALPVIPYQIGNWSRDNPDLGKFDLLIASDVLYERDQPGVLAQFMDQHAHAHCGQLSAGLRKALGIQIDDTDIRPRLAHFQCGGATKAGRGAGDDDCFAIHIGVDCHWIFFL